MSDSDLSVKILQEIRDELREDRKEQAKFRAHVERRFDGTDQRFEVIETSLRDLAEQMVMLSRAIKSLIEGRGNDDGRIGALERRVDALEEKVS